MRNPQPRRWPYLFWVLGVVLLVGSVAGAGWLYGGRRLAPGDPGTVTATPLIGQIVLTGHVDVERGLVSLYPVQPGKVSEVPVQEGDHVSAGTVLIKLDDEVAQAQLEMARADVKAAQAQLSQAERLPRQHELKVAQQTSAITAFENKVEAAKQGLARREELHKLGTAGVSKEEVAGAAALMREAEAGLAAERDKLLELKEIDDPQVAITRARADLTAKEARLKQAEWAVREMAVRAPTEGTILRILTGVGEVLGPSPRQAALLFVPDLPRIVRVDVEQEFAARLKLGQPATIQDDIQPADAWKGHVQRLSGGFMQKRAIVPEPIQFGNDVRTLECVIALEGSPPLRIGQKVRVTVQTADVNANP